MAELWDVYDKSREKTSKTVHRGDKLLEGEYHLVVNIWVMNANGEVLLQKRSMKKALAPGLWSCTGGAAIAGETSMQTCMREMTEELGVVPIVNHAEIAFSMTRDSYHKDVWFLYQNISPDEFHLQEEEVNEVRWVTIDQLEREARDSSTIWQLPYMEDVLAILKAKLPFLEVAHAKDI